MSDDHSAFSLSELRASLATEHLNAGEIKLARRQFRQSLKAPTENALAQAKWAQGVDKAIEISSDLLGRPEAHEAHALDTARIGHWERSLIATGEWKADERFSDKPFVHASWISTGPLNSPANALPWLHEGLVANPDDPSLLNNLAVAKAMLGDLDKANDALIRARKNAEDDALPLTLAATEWPAAGFVDTEIRCLTELERGNAKKEVRPRVQARGSEAGEGSGRLGGAGGARSGSA